MDNNTFTPSMIVHYGQVQAENEKLRADLAGANQKLGLTKITLEHNETLLASCEAALERDQAALAAAQEELRALRAIDAAAAMAMRDSLMEVCRQRDEAREELRKAREQEKPRTSEYHFAMRDAHMSHDSDAYFAARPEFPDNTISRTAFNAGFHRGFDAGEKVYAAPVPAILSYAYRTLREYEDIVGFSVNEAFKAGWTMARTTNAMLGILSATDTEGRKDV